MTPAPVISSRLSYSKSARRSPARTSIKTAALIAGSMGPFQALQQLHHLRCHLAAPAEAKFVIEGGKLLHQAADFGGRQHPRELSRREPRRLLKTAARQTAEHPLIKQRRGRKRRIRSPALLRIRRPAPTARRRAPPDRASRGRTSEN